MKNTINKFLIIAAIVGSLAFNTKAANTAITVVNTTMTNMIGGVTSTPVRVTSFTLLSGASTSATLLVYDSPTNSTTYTIPAYTNIVSYATNYITIWTNYYGVTNRLTNVYLVDVTNSVASSTGTYPLKFQVTAPTNGSITLEEVNATFVSGMWATNTGNGSGVANITYQQ